MFWLILTIRITSLPLLTKNPLITVVLATLKVNAPSYIKAIIYNLISCTRLISSSKTMFYKELKNIKQTLINNGFPNYIVNEQIKPTIKNVSQQNEHCNTPPNKHEFIKLFYSNQMPYNYKLDENVLKKLIQINTPHWS